MKTRTLFLLFLAGLLAAGAALRPSPTEAAADDFARFVDDYFEAQFRARPSAGTAAGLHQYDGSSRTSRGPRIEPASPSSSSCRRASRRSTARRLSFDDAIDAQALEGDPLGTLQASRSCAPGRTTRWRTSGVPGNACRRADQARLRSGPRPSARDRRAASGRAFASTPRRKANVKNPPKEFTDLAIRMSQGLGRLLRAHGAAWAKDAAGEDAALFAEFEKANAAVVGHCRTCGLAGDRPAPALQGQLRHRRGELPRQAEVRRHGRAAARRPARARRGQLDEGLRGVRRDGASRSIPRRRRRR